MASENFDLEVILKILCLERGKIFWNRTLKNTSDRQLSVRFKIQ